MIKSYLKIAWRGLMKNKAVSFINIFGLTIGLTCCILISLYINHETSYDRYHKNRDRIFQLGTAFIDGGVAERGGNSSAPLGMMLQQEYPEITSTTRILPLFRDDKTLLQVKGEGGPVRSFYERKGFLADSNFFQVLTYDFSEGDPKNALLEPNTIVISKEISRKLFGDEPALNKIIRVSSNTHGDSSFRITGVFADPPGPSHIDANFFLSFGGGNMARYVNDNPSLANNNMFYTYLLLKEGADSKKVEQKFPDFIRRHLGEELKQTGKQREYFLTGVADIYLAGIGKGLTPGGSKTRLFVLGSIAVLILLIACINFMNLSTANSGKKAAEVGVRKVLGAQQSSLLRRFLGESMLMTIIGLLFALGLTLLLLPVFEQVSGKTLNISFLQKLKLAGLFIFLAIVTGLLAGSYPAFYLSSFKPISVLKGKFSNSMAAISLRKGLVVFQFIISIVLIIASLVIADQMKYMRSKDLGFAKDQQVIIPLRTPTAKNSIPAFKNNVADEPAIHSIGASMAYPGIFHPQDWLMYRQGQSMTNSKQVYINLVDDDYLQTLDVKLLAGRLFSREFPADSLTRFVINEEAVKQFGFASPEEAVGKWLAFDSDGEQVQFTIIGVIKSFHFKDLHEAIEPFAFRLYNEAGFNYLLVNSKGSDLKRTMASLESTWKKLNPAEPFEYSFLDTDFQKNYEADSRQASLINYFTIIAIIISCLGLFGLVTFTAEQRVKEIGIRKVLGASVYGLVTLLSRDFLKLVLIAVIIASPLAWWLMNKWLHNFAYQTRITWQVFGLTCFAALLIAFLTISFQAIKAAIANPVKSLRTE
ncbi:MAG TPA: ABC transporter permease [Chitinophagaceae bacterium]|jgi:putative ABC transport system permease protein|nr:ABC transporter permease [Chitinophagaceae bacterium]